MILGWLVTVGPFIAPVLILIAALIAYPILCWGLRKLRIGEW